MATLVSSSHLYAHHLALPQFKDTSDISEKEVLKNGKILFIGTATCLIQYAGFTILTDPNFIHKDEKISLGIGLHATRHTNPAIELENLPPIDFIVLTHTHEDHLDSYVQKHMDRTIPIITNEFAAKTLESLGFTQILALSANFSSVLVSRGIEKTGPRCIVTMTPAQHGPKIASFMIPPTNGFILEFGNGIGNENVMINNPPLQEEVSSSQTQDSNLGGIQIIYRMYITGDTLLCDEMNEIKKRYPTLDCTLLYLGGTKLMGVLMTLDADQGVEFMQLIQSKVTIPIHYNDYDIYKSNLKQFQEKVKEISGDINIMNDMKIIYLSPGQSWDIVDENLKQKLSGIMSSSDLPIKASDQRPIPSHDLLNMNNNGEWPGQSTFEYNLTGGKSVRDAIREGIVRGMEE